jgi:hypothetical protein
VDAGSDAVKDSSWASLPARLGSVARRWGPVVLALAVIAYYVQPIWRQPETWAGWWDCRYYWFVVEVDYTTIVEHHQLPLWNPYYCGGAPQLANPQTATLSPLTWLVLPFGMSIGYRLGYTAGLVAALFSMRAYARALGLSDVASAVAGAGFAVSGALAMHMGGGHWPWIAFIGYPLVLRSMTLAVDGRRAHYVWGAFWFAAIVFHSAIYPFAYGFLTVGAYGALLALDGVRRDRARVGRAIVATATTIGLGLALAAVRVLPIWQHVSTHPRPVNDKDYTWPWELFITYGWRHPERGFGEHQYVFPEFGNYFGIAGLVLVAAGAFVVARRRRALWPVVGAALVFVLFQLGNLRPLPWWLVKQLPVYEHLRVPSRFTLVAGIFFLALVGVAVDEWGGRALARWRTLTARRRLAAAGVLALGVVYLLDAASWNRLQFVPTFGSPPPTEPRATEFHQVAGDRGNMMAYPRANLGSLSCVEETPLDISPRLRGDLPAEEYLAEPDAGSVRRLRWSPNRIELEVDAKRPTTVLVNQNADVGWRVDGAALVAGGDGGLLAARVEAGHHLVTFRYLPGGFVVGAIVSVLAAAGSAAFLLAQRRRRRRRFFEPRE